MKTDKLIEDLSNDLKPIKSASTQGLFLMKAFAVATILIALGLLILPARLDLESKLMIPDYLFESSLWLIVATLGAILVYRHSVPGLKLKPYLQLFLVTLTVLVFKVLSGKNFSGTLVEELKLSRGICGMLITALAIVGAGFFFYWSKKMAPTDYKSTGFWILVSSAALGSFGMQFVCAHDTAVHLYLWHFIPTFLLAGLGALVASKILRW